MDKKINSATESREYLIQEMKKQLVGPQDGHFTEGVASFQFNPNNPERHKQEILTKSPRLTYTAGTLFPQESTVLSDEEEENIEENLEEETNQSTTKQTSAAAIDDDNEQVTDNNFDIDLTNELRASAIGMSVLASTNHPIIVGTNDMGRYESFGKDTAPKNLLIICYYLAKEKESYSWMSSEYKLSNKNQSTCFQFLEEKFGIKNIKMKYRDYFDTHFENRKGWKRKNNKIDAIVNELKELDKESLQLKVKEAINNSDSTESVEVLEGYGRESINSNIEVSPEELKSQPLIRKKLLNKNKEEIGLDISISLRTHQDKDKKYLTIALVNSNETNKDKILVSKCFFQSNIFVKPKNKDETIFYPFDQIDLKDASGEERSLYLLHHKRKSFAIGHGCSVAWDLEDNKCTKIRTEIIPVFETKPIIPQKFKDLNLNMKLFSEDLSFAKEELKKLTIKYSKWLDTESTKGEQMQNEYFKLASKNNVEKSKKILKRMEEGIKILESDKNAQKAFQFMNQSMYLQQVHHKIPKNTFSNNINYEQQLRERGKGNWHPFQIAFIVLNIKSFTEPHSKDREIMDLIWFPTGGGKTEAYLGLTAFTIFLRKLVSKDVKGCAVLMRYTLRLLTTQQFQRASSLICACEKIRRENKEILGNEKISIGLWIGGESTPNKENKAKDYLSELIRQPTYITNNKFVLLSCPWCSADLPPKSNSTSTGYKILRRKFFYVCPNKECSFSKDEGHLPITVIDESIYKDPPTLLIGTIDKFASLSWISDAISMFDKEGLTKPDLIIQDELHLISGPLGSVAGMYEILITALTEKEVNNKKINAKIVGSTATISRAETQIRNLYARDCNIFPPQINQLEDSFFSYEDKKQLGRKYVGIFCSSASSPQITLAKIISTMAIGGTELRRLSEKNPEAFDPYWTHLIYFNSIRELMSGSALINADVKGNLSGEYFRKGFTKDFMGEFFKEMRRRLDNVKELTSRIESSTVPEILETLFIKSINNDKKNAVDVCLSTNMIQVGIDIPRLGLMTIVGQPKTTSEYIQASSRVGREYPGLVLTMLSPFRPRDRSHYEKFHSYHENLYKFVEPTSITSHSDPVRSRCLHAIVIGLARLWGPNLRSSPSIPNKDLIDKIKKYIIDYVERSDPKHPEEKKKTEKEIDYIIEKWTSLNPQEYGRMVVQPNASVLMIPSGSELPEEGDPFETPTSMRNVDKECQARIITSYRGTE